MSGFWYRMGARMKEMGERIGRLPCLGTLGSVIVRAGLRVKSRAMAGPIGK